MRKLWLLFVVIIAFAVCAGCRKNNARNLENAPHWFSSYKEFKQKDYYSYLVMKNERKGDNQKRV